MVEPPTCMPSSANGVLQDWANASITGVLGAPVPQISPSSLLRVLPLGRVSGCGEATATSGVLDELWSYQAEVVTILNVEPGGRVVWVALFSSGLGSSLSSWLST